MQLAVSNTTKGTPVLPSRSHTGGTGSVRPGNSYTRMPYQSLDHVLANMRGLVSKFKGSPMVRQKAVEITQGIAKDPRTGLANRRDYQAIAEAVYSWLKKNIAYVRDPAGIEWLQSPDKTLQYGFGDCDDQSILPAALMSSIGIPTRFVVVKADAGNKDAFSHVYLEYEANGEWHPFDTTLHTRAGHGPQQIFGKKVMPLNDVATSTNGGKKKVCAPVLP